VDEGRWRDEKYLTMQEFVLYSRR